MAGDGIRITAALREKFNAYIGAELLTKEDEGQQLIDGTYMGLDNNAPPASSRLNTRGDGVIGIRYDDDHEKIISTKGKVTGFLCTDVYGERCTRARLWNVRYKGTLDVNKARLAIIGLFGESAVPIKELRAIRNPSAIEGAKIYFLEFTQPPVTTDPYDGPSGQEGDCR